MTDVIVGDIFLPSDAATVKVVADGDTATGTDFGPTAGAKDAWTFTESDATLTVSDAVIETITAIDTQSSGIDTFVPADFDAIYATVVARNKARQEKRLRPGVVRLWDGNWVLRGQAMHVTRAEFTEIDRETGTGVIEMPEEYYLSQWIINVDDRPVKNIHCTVDKDGARWSGRLHHYELAKGDDGKVTLSAYFKHDYEEFKHIICWANPFLPAEVQFPRLWILFGPARWAVKTTLLVNVMRLESSLWMLPDDPMDMSQWFNFNQSTWSMVVKPDTHGIFSDSSPTAIVLSRFKNFHEATQHIMEDGQLTPTFRRYLSGDPPPWPGANLRHGCLVIDIEDKSGWSTGTSSFGSIFTGLVRSFTEISSDGMTEGVDVYNDPALGDPEPDYPDEYFLSGWMGTKSSAPGLIYREGEHTGITSSLFVGTPATAITAVTGGHSMPGVNELISATINIMGDLIAAILFVPPIGGALDAILKPLYTDVFLAFMAWKDIGRAQEAGWSHYHETWAQGADRAYTLKAVIALRTALWATREHYTHKLTVRDGAPWTIGQHGYGHFHLGDRIGSTIKGTPTGKIFVDRVSEIDLSWDREKPPTWEITIGERKQEDPLVKALERMQAIMGALVDVGVL